MTFKMSEQAQTIKIYNLRSDTNEFIGAGDAYIPPHTGLPAHCTDIEPPEIPAGSIAVFDSEKNTWNVVEDHRGQTVYRTDTGEAIWISELGSLPENVTTISSDGQYEKWDGTKWVKDEEAEKAARLREAEETKKRLLQLATDKIAPLQDAVDLGIVTEKETSLLEVWKTYRVLLNRVDTSAAPDIKWPAPPQ
ncbi:tail fiber assembly protein [Salmonella enterica subsp. enterica serovar Pomona]|nr:tail fiber assembly protein [Salmonella enterica subsp. enterica serovar Poona]EAP4203240.1 tail fiber assembly protein [Salmonella enterica subsp. enterica serovar Poona]EAR0439829.1 tail fiber assembly protein [Salmonella enterica subsp. enterica serovar Poona]EDV0941173.1 tail fiber assembly protein [Salmonella enterica subsp. enterica serovar Pomona]EGP1949312.1 tail fiber assembly protein [Salmonella enterica]